MVTILIIFIFLSLVAAIIAFGAGLASPASAVGSRLQELLTPVVDATRRKPGLGKRLQHMLEPLGALVPKSSAESTDTRSWLTQAGYRDATYVKIYFGIRAFAAILFALFAIFTGLAARSPILLIIMPLLGYMLPRFMLKRRIAARQEAIQLALPDALDLTTICVDAGLGLDQALERVATEIRLVHSALSSELDLMILEMRAGKPRAEALRNLATRTGVEDIRAFVAVLIQTERFGTSIASSLRVHGDVLRTERRQRAEERASKTTIKIVPPLVLFIFPVLFFVVIGPAVISVIRIVLPELNK
jgi:tight adherence protein C